MLRSFNITTTSAATFAEILHLPYRYKPWLQLFSGNPMIILTTIILAFEDILQLSFITYAITTKFFSNAKNNSTIIILKFIVVEKGAPTKCITQVFVFSFLGIPSFRISPNVNLFYSYDRWALELVVCFC